MTVRHSRSDAEILRMVVEGKPLNYYEIARVFNLLNMFPTKGGGKWNRQSVEYIEGRALSKLTAWAKEVFGEKFDEKSKSGVRRGVGDGVSVSGHGQRPRTRLGNGRS